VPWHAIEAVDDALTATRRFLLPFDFGTWLRLAVVAFFLGGAGTPTNLFNFTVDRPGRLPGEVPGVPPDMPLPSDQLLQIVAVVAVIAAILGLAFAILSAIMEFVLVDAVVAREIHVRRYVRDRLGKGLRLFGFQIAVGLLVVVAILALLAPVALAGGRPVLWLVVLAIPLFLGLALLVGAVFLLTTDFVVPVMVARDVGVLDGWRAFWPTLRADLAQVGLYVVIRWVLALGVAIAVGLVTGLIGLAFLVVVGLPVGLAFFATGGLGPLVLALAVVVGIPVLLAFLLAVALVQVPVQTYFRYYALLVLGDLEPEFDLLGEFGRAVREESTEG
jgi:hypothetical protein